MAVCYVGIGSNLGERRRYIRRALQKINTLKDTRILKTSGIIETEPVGGPARQGKFLNAAIKIETFLVPRLLLRNLKRIERELGRTKTVRWGPRIIDLDILFYGGSLIATGALQVPHPRIFERRFVLEPLLQIL